MAWPSGSFLDVNTPILPDETFLQSHVYWDQYGFHEVRPFAWTTVGAPVINQKNHIAGYPPYVSGLTDAIYYTGSVASDSLDTTGNRFGAIVFIPQAIDATTRALFTNGVAATGGYDVGINGTTGTWSFTVWAPGSFAVTTANAVIPFAVNVAVWWKTGTDIFTQLNLGAVATMAGASEAAATGQNAFIGRYNAGGNSFNGGIIEIAQGVGTMPTNWGLRAQQMVLDKIGSANAWIRS